MLPQCLKCKNNTKSKNPKVVKAKNGRIMVISNCAVSIVKNQDLLKNKKLVEGNLLGTEIPVLGDLSLTNIFF